MRMITSCSLSRAALFVVAAVTSSSGCNDSGGLDPNAAPPKPIFVGAPGVQLTRVTIYQGVERELMIDGQPSAADAVELVAGREAVVRLFYKVSGYDGKPVTGRITVDSGAPIEVTEPLGAGSSQGSLPSTVNLRIPAERVTGKLSFSAALGRELPASPAPADNPSARWPADGSRTSIDVTGIKNSLRVILVPFQYNFDHSGRLPDTTAAQVERYRQRFYQLYPVSSVEVKVHAPVPWAQVLARDGTGWDAVGQELSGLREIDGENYDVYYYAIFNPASTLNKYCGNGCLLGVTLLNDQPEDTGNPELRLALGVGYTETAADTAAHEIGHSHGLMHANCGQGLDPNSIDRTFPYPNGGVGVWGYDLVGNKLIAPQGYSDIMGYCDRQWISDFHFTKILHRGVNVNMPRRLVPGDDAEPQPMAPSRVLPRPVLHDVIAIDASGEARFSRRVMSSAVESGAGGERVAVRLTSDAGSVREVTGRYHRWDHMPGGWLLVPRPETMVAAPLRAEFQIDHAARVALRP